jgi:SAM-dependent methyltransferase
MNIYLHALLEYFWLRPETAVWRALDCAALHDIEFTAPILDIGCGDGALSFMRAGGRYSIHYDFSTQTGKLDQFFEGEDIYNHFDASKAGEIVATPARYKIDFGFDHKQALLDKAGLIGLYKKTIAGDANRPLPFDDASLSTVYSNILYWLEDYPTTLRQIARILKPGGQCILQVPSENFRDFSFYQRLFVRTGDQKWEWLKSLDRGRSDNIKNCKSERDWTRDFANAGLRVERCTPYLPGLVLEAWDIGLRPISPMLIEMSNELTAEKRASIKRKWVDNLLPMLLPLCDYISDKNGFLLFVLRKQQTR